MTTVQSLTLIAVPVTLVLVLVFLIAVARPDADQGVYAAYLAIAALVSLYLLLVAVGGLGEAIAQRLALGDDASSIGSGGSPAAVQLYFNLAEQGGSTAIAAFGALAVLMGASLVFHTRRRSELLAAYPDGSVARIDRAYRAAVCVAMIALIAAASVAAGAAGYQFFSDQIAVSDKVRNLAMGTLLAYGGLVLVAGLVFRASFWAIRENDETPEVAAPAEPGDA